MQEIENFASYTLIKFAALLAPCGSNNHYMYTTIINNWTPPSQPIFLGGPPFSVKNSS
jgi:hypothetical protein